MTSSERECPVACLDWTQLPDLWDPLFKTFGGPMYTHKSKTRRTIDQKLRHTCEIWRSKYPGPCTAERQRRCRRLFLKAIHDMTAPNVQNQWAMLSYSLNRITNDESAHALLKQTVPKADPERLRSIIPAIDL